MAKRIVLVDDDAPTREIFAEWIRGTDGFKLVAQYADGETALAGLPRDKPDVALMDINLPVVSGVECVRQLKSLLPQTQFVMLTVYDDADKIFDALSSGATGYLLKQTSKEELVAAIREVQAGGSPMSSHIARKVVQCFQHSLPFRAGSEALTPRELEALVLLSQGYAYKEIADRLGLSLHTVNAHTRSIYEKLHVHSRAQAVARYTAPPQIKREARTPARTGLPYHTQIPASQFEPLRPPGTLSGHS